jgi:hypothetical protein
MGPARLSIGIVPATTPSKEDTQVARGAWKSLEGAYHAAYSTSRTGAIRNAKVMRPVVVVGHVSDLSVTSSSS